VVAKSKKMEKANSQYLLSFTAGGLLVSQSLVVVDEYARSNDWTLVAENVESQNLLQTRTTSTSKRLLHEIVSRLRLLTIDQLDVLRSGPRSDQQQLLWLAVCKRYRVLYEFASEVVRHKYLQMDLVVVEADFDNLLDEKSIWHPEIEDLAASTRAKLRQVAFRMLREADILSTENVIQPTILSVEIARVIQSDSVTHFTVFPVSESDVRGTLA